MLIDSSVGRVHFNFAKGLSAMGKTLFELQGKYADGGWCVPHEFDTEEAAVVAGYQEMADCDGEGRRRLDDFSVVTITGHARATAVYRRPVLVVTEPRLRAALVELLEAVRTGVHRPGSWEADCVWKLFAGWAMATDNRPDLHALMLAVCEIADGRPAPTLPQLEGAAP